MNLHASFRVMMVVSGVFAAAKATPFGVATTPWTGVPSGERLAGFTQHTGDWNIASAKLADIDGDGVDDVLVASAALHVWNGAGTELPGFPVATSTVFAPAVGDLDGDGAVEIVLAASSELLVLRRDGSTLPGWPRPLAPSGAPSLADLDGDGRLEIIVPSGFAMNVFHDDGTSVPGFPVTGPPKLSTAAVGDLDGDGALEIVSDSYTIQGSPTGYVNAWHADGIVVAGFPVSLPGSPASLGPALVDLHRDGRPRIAVSILARGSPVLENALYVIDGQGRVEPCFPVYYSAYGAGSPTGADLDGDGYPEVIVAGGTVSPFATTVQAYHRDGSMAVGFPVAFTQSTSFGNNAGCPAGDVDGDGLPEVLVKCGNYVDAVHHDGTPVAGFPIYLAEGNSSATWDPAPAIGDMDGDGYVEVVAVSLIDQVIVVDQPGPYVGSAVAWPSCRRDSRNQAMLPMPAGCPIGLHPLTLPVASLGAPYSATILAAGGSPPYTFAVRHGTLPPGLALSASGTIAGTCTVGGSFTFTVTASDAASCVGSLVYVIDVGPLVDHVVGQGPGPGNPNRFRVFTGSGAATGVDVLAYGATWGVNVASGDVDARPPAEVVTAPGPGITLGPQVRAFTALGAPMPKLDYYCYGTLRHGANVAVGDVDGDGYGEMVTGAGPGGTFGPHVRGFTYSGAWLQTKKGVSFFAYGSLGYGVNVGTGDVDRDGHAEALTGPGPGPTLSPHVRGWELDGCSVRPIGRISFIAFPATRGVGVAAGDVDADGFAEITTATGPSPALSPHFRGFDYDATTVRPLSGFDLTLPVSTGYGGRVGTGDVLNNGSDELLAGAGPDPAAASTVRSYVYTGSALVMLPGAFDPFSPGYGVNVAGARLGY